MIPESFLPSMAFLERPEFILLFLYFRSLWFNTWLPCPESVLCARVRAVNESDVSSSWQKYGPQRIYMAYIGVVTITQTEYVPEVAHSILSLSTQPPAMLSVLQRHQFHLQTLFNGCLRGKVTMVMNKPELRQFDEWLRTLVICQRSKSKRKK